jgi:hypothetical protein
MKLEDIAKKLLVATKRGEVDALWAALEAEHGGRARPLGDRDSNLPAVHITSDPDATQIERFTNGVDGTLEALAEKKPVLKTATSPREFVKKAFGLKHGNIALLAKKEKEQLADDTGLTVRILPGDVKDAPTIEVRDQGTGLLAGDMPKTILSLNQSNKIDKWYLMGRFGQGGSTTLRFSDYTIIASRRQPTTVPNAPIAFTIVRYEKPKPGEKDGKYVYMVGTDNVPFSIPASALSFEPGTLVRQINYRFSKRVIFADVYAIFERYLFDPVLPFRLIEERTGKKDMRRIYGSRDHLTRSEQVVAKDELEVQLTEDPAMGRLTIRYFASGTETKVKQLFIDPDEPIVVTYLGQTHAQIPRRLLANECKLSYLYKDLVVQVDCDNIPDEARQRMLTTGRERVTKEGQDLLETAIVAALKDDEDLRALEHEREAEFFSGKSHKVKEQMQRKLAEMINRIRPGTFTVPVGSGTTTRKRKSSSGTAVPPKPPLDTNSFPTYLKIANKSPIMLVHGSTARIELNSDAPDGFLTAQGSDGSLEFVGDAEKKLRLTVKSKDFAGGRLYLRVEPSDGAAPGDSFEVKIVLRAKDKIGHVVAHEAVAQAIVEKPKTGGPGTATTLSAPNIIEVGPDVEDAGAQKFWHDNHWTEDHVAEVKTSDSSIAIFVSVANKWLVGALKESKYPSSTKEMMRDKYVLHAAFHAYIQEEAYKKLNGSVPESTYEKLKAAELERAARTILTAITSEGAFAKDEVDLA